MDLRALRNSEEPQVARAGVEAVLREPRGEGRRGREGSRVPQKVGFAVRQGSAVERSAPAVVQGAAVAGHPTLAARDPAARRHGPRGTHGDGRAGPRLRPRSGHGGHRLPPPPDIPAPGPPGRAPRTAAGDPRHGGSSWPAQKLHPANRP